MTQRLPLRLRPDLPDHSQQRVSPPPPSAAGRLHRRSPALELSRGRGSRLLKALGRAQPGPSPRTWTPSAAPRQALRERRLPGPAARGPASWARGWLAPQLRHSPAGHAPERPTKSCSQGPPLGKARKPRLRFRGEHRRRLSLAGRRRESSGGLLGCLG